MSATEKARSEAWKTQRAEWLEDADKPTIAVAHSWFVAGWEDNSKWQAAEASTSGEKLVTIGFDGGTTYALTGENAGHWVEGSPTIEIANEQIEAVAMALHGYAGYISAWHELPESHRRRFRAMARNALEVARGVPHE